MDEEHQLDFESAQNRALFYFWYRISETARGAQVKAKIIKITEYFAAYVVTVAMASILGMAHGLKSAAKLRILVVPDWLLPGSHAWAPAFLF